MLPIDADGIVKSIDPEAVWSGSALFAQTYQSQFLEFLLHHKKKVTKIQKNLTF